MNHFFKRTLFVNKNLSKIKTVFRSISGADQSHYNNHYKYKSHNTQQKIFYYGIVGATTITCVGLYKFFDDRYKYAHAASKKDTEETVVAGSYRPDMKLYSMDEIITHKTKDKRIWVIYKEGVYDVTDFVESHPGGEIILQAAGSSIEPFWTIYGIHKSNEVYEMLECLRVGNVSKKESEKFAKTGIDPYTTDPIRHPALKPASKQPFNAEPTPSSLLTENFNTSNDVFYVRNHLPVPVVDPETYKLEIEIEGTKKKLSLTLDELKKFKKHDVVAVLMCAGNRRSEMSEVRTVKGLFWGNAAIGNAVWTGVYLRDVLMSMGISDESNYKHVQFEGLDIDPAIKGRFYGASVPFNFVMDKYGDVLLAYEMNGEPLPRDHGFPLRVIVPGVCGARNVKWLSKVVVSNEESKAFWQQNDYKSFNSSTQFDTANYANAQAIQKLPVTSAICVPSSGETVHLENGYMTVKGYAYSGGGNKIFRVDVTVDGGVTWHAADLENNDKTPPNHWSWSLWTVKIPINPELKEVEIWAKAMDSNHNTQPETFEHIWNIRGVLGNAYHRIKVKINPSQSAKSKFSALLNG